MFRLLVQQVKYKVTAARWFLVDDLMLTHLLYQLLFAWEQHFARVIRRYDPSTSVLGLVHSAQCFVRALLVYAAVSALAVISPVWKLVKLHVLHFSLVYL